MSLVDDISEEYFEWMENLVCRDRFARGISYDKLLRYLHSREFIFSIPRDSNRASDGIDLRRRWALFDEELADYLDGPCSVLEMMLALALRCEENIMDDPSIGNRTGQWFWGMIVSLGLGSMTDDIFDENYVKFVVDRFLNREYEPNGKGGLFTIKNCDQDLRRVEIWYQLCWYLDRIA